MFFSGTTLCSSGTPSNKIIYLLSYELQFPCKSSCNYLTSHSLIFSIHPITLYDNVVQCALLYTTVHGQRRIRVSTLSLPCTNMLSNLFRSADLDTQFACITKQGTWCRSFSGNAILIIKFVCIYIVLYGGINTNESFTLAYALSYFSCSYIYFQICSLHADM